ncbi:MAG: hypothetical protein HY275_15415 [Gemmatimonadetes bacterium]|nr:hypothetical protein [Gemmatimonadota bacterium]
MISAALAAQLAALRAQATASTVPGGLLAWWGSSPMPDGAPGASPLSLSEWTRTMYGLRQAALSPGLVPSMASVNAMTTALRCDGPLPVALTHYRGFRPRATFAAEVMAAAQSGGALREPVPPLAEVIEPFELFMSAAPMHEQWAQANPVFRSRFVTWSFDQRFLFIAPGDPIPTRIAFDAGDGRGFRDVRFGDVLASTHPTGDTITFAVRCWWGTTLREARGTVQLGGPAAPPMPDDTWRVGMPGGNAGTAWVFRAPGHADVVRPVIFTEGFPGGFACDYLYEMFNQGGLITGLQAAGHDVILVGYDNGTCDMTQNASVIQGVLATVASRTTHRAAIGGVSMGGLIPRYALAWMEAHGLPHHAHLYVSIDAPHRGSATAVAIQWFARYFASSMPLAADFETLLDTPANRQFLVQFLEDATVGLDPLRTQWLAALAAVGGYPRQVRRIALASGSGAGGRSITPGSTMLTWDGSPFIGCTLRASGASGDSVTVAEGRSLLADPAAPARVTMTSHAGWEGVPGGQNDYTATAAVIAGMLRCGMATPAGLGACSVPTVSALDLDVDPTAPVPPHGTVPSPFDDALPNTENAPHCTISAAQARWLIEHITTSARAAAPSGSPS